MQNSPAAQFKTKKVFFKFTFFSLLALIMFSSTKLLAQGDLLIYPKRLVFDGSKKSQDLNLSNSGRDTAKYIISVVQIRMKEDGTFENISVPDSGQNFADAHFRFFPRNVVLAPNETQTVKIQLTKTDQMVAGEYRSHMYLRAEPEKKPLGEDEAPKDSGSISVRLVPIFGISIPVIIKVGESTSKVSLTDAALEMVKDTIPALKVKFNRTGNMSVYGDITVEHISETGQATRVGQVQGVAVYSPTASRLFHILLDAKKGIDYKSGKLHILYTDQSPKANKLAEDEVNLNRQPSSPMALKQP